MKTFREKIVQNRRVCFLCGRPTLNTYKTLPICVECKRKMLLEEGGVKSGEKK